ncbi:MAG TPA: hypothetical protein DCK76_02705 [Desulfotomaculum sp.]|nr:hypothetical protein [Desulfotomaculum sp.]HBY03023.1 hypothetical protein [Desulfotomaculum sp.]
MFCFVLVSLKHSVTTLLSLRFIAEQLGCKVEWDSSTQEIKITDTK